MRWSSQQEVMQAWMEWMLSVGLPKQQADLFIERGYDLCCYLRDAIG